MANRIAAPSFNPDKFKVNVSLKSGFTPIYLSISANDDMRFIAAGMKATMDRFADAIGRTTEINYSSK